MGLEEPAEPLVPPASRLRVLHPMSGAVMPMETTLVGYQATAPTEVEDEAARLIPLATESLVSRFHSPTHTLGNLLLAILPVKLCPTLAQCLLS